MAKLCMCLAFVLLTAHARSYPDDQVSCLDSPIRLCEEAVQKCNGMPGCDKFQLWKDQKCSTSATTKMCCLSYYLKFMHYPRGCTGFMSAFQ